MTYDSLLVDVRRYLERGFTAESDAIVYEQLPRLITLGERRIARELKIEGFIRAVQTPLQPGVAVYRKPDRWRDTVSMTVDNSPVFARSYEYIRNYWPDEAANGKPEYYADYDYQHWIIAPTPATAQTWEILYYEQPALLGEDFQTNWLTEYAPDLLLYATLLEATPFLKKDERIQTWQAMYDRAAQAISGEDLKRIMDRTASRSEA
jgi:transglutaminase-like putative cysteine protease